MDDNLEEFTLQELFDLGVFNVFALMLAIGCTLWLVISRVRGCFRHRAPDVAIDLACLLAAPVVGTLISIFRCAAVTAAYVSNNPDLLDIDRALSWSLREASTTSSLALICFLAGLVSLMLPQKRMNPPKDE